MRIPIARPLLPTADDVLPYLKRIDQTRWYSNGGPLVLEFEERLARHCGEQGRVATVANATIGLTLALLASDLPPGSLCMMPSWTFAATGHAVLLAGLIPWMIDVGVETMALDAERSRSILPDAPGQVAAVIPVSPFGAPLDMAGWRRFRRETGVAVIADMAAAFDCVCASEIPAVVSLHATKTCGIGEGGFVVSTDPGFIEEIQKRANFGFWNSREATARSMNGKLSEYGAAVGLASLDHWPTIRADFQRVALAYRKNFREQPGVRLQTGFGNNWISSTMMIESLGDGAEAVAAKLAGQDIETRRWWGSGLHRHEAFCRFPRHELKVTEGLARRVIGLPCWRDLPNECVREICQIVARP
ncbi:MAG: DegT/DnrJ/EryC1/StrS family aminotransferase [Chthoniobacterales bacterium]